MVFAQGEELDISDDDQLVCILIEDSLERKKNIVIDYWKADAQFWETAVILNFDIKRKICLIKYNFVGTVEVTKCRAVKKPSLTNPSLTKVTNFRPEPIIFESYLNLT